MVLPCEQCTAAAAAAGKQASKQKQKGLTWLDIDVRAQQRLNL